MPREAETARSERQSRKWRIEVEVDESGRVEAALWIDGTPADGHADSTGTLTVQQLLAPLTRRVSINAEDARRRPLR